MLSVVSSGEPVALRRTMRLWLTRPAISIEETKSELLSRIDSNADLALDKTRGNEA